MSLIESIVIVIKLAERDLSNDVTNVPFNDSMNDVNVNFHLIISVSDIYTYSTY